MVSNSHNAKILIKPKDTGLRNLDSKLSRDAGLWAAPGKACPYSCMPPSGYMNPRWLLPPEASLLARRFTGLYPGWGWAKEREISTICQTSHLGCCCSPTKLHLTLCDPMVCSMPGSPVLYCFLQFAQIHVHWVSDAIQPSHLLSPHLLFPSIFSGIRVFSNELALCIRWPKY